MIMPAIMYNNRRYVLTPGMNIVLKQKDQSKKRGVFANSDFKQGMIIEEAPVIIVLAMKSIASKRRQSVNIYLRGKPIRHRQSMLERARFAIIL